ncbi:MAG: dihydroneopterin aldolase [Rhodobacteraceae bacterium]|nr:dihydroneopterin aldolase [Paracoccaceae bacterium]
MMDETAIAFEAPNVRAAATASGAPLDRISVRDYEREVEIGAFQSERGVQQRIRFNVVLEVSRHDAARDDDVDKVISYDTITEAIELQLTTERINLLETLAERVAERCLEDPRAVRAFVRIEKLDRIPGTLGVEIVRMRHGAETIHPVEVEKVDATPHPLVVCLSNEALHGPNLGAWLDAIAGHVLPAIICVEPAMEAAPQSASSLVQRRIDLLSMEQNAWILAGKDSRCVVVDSRTELDWAMKHEQLSVWAPSKIVMDAVPHPKDISPAALAIWLAREFDAKRVLLVGFTEPSDKLGVAVGVVGADFPPEIGA